MEKKKMKTYTLDDIKNKYIGKRGTKEREEYEKELQEITKGKHIRRSGETTRLADSHIQDLFNFGETVVHDHYNTNLSHKELFDKVLSRLKTEHKQHFHPNSTIRIDFDKRTFKLWLTREGKKAITNKIS